MSFTIEQLEALKEGTTPGPWEAKDDHGGPNLFSPTGRLLHSDSCGDVSGNEDDVRLMAAAPALVDALITERRAHQKLRAEVDELRDVHWEKYKELDQYATWLERQYGAEPVRNNVAQEAEDERKAAARLAQILEGE